MNRRATIPFLLLLTSLAANTDAGVIDYHVDADTPAAPGAADGLSWATAFPALQQALAIAQGGQEVWVAEGVYCPADGPGGRAASFVIPDGLMVYGGFDGTETSRNQRDPALNETVLHGDIAGDDGLPTGDGVTNNSYHVVTIAGAGSAITRLDGFTIAGGYAANPALGDYILGGGLFAVSSFLTAADCVFKDNFASGNGGAVYAWDSTLAFEDCVFEANCSYGYGAGIAFFPDYTPPDVAALTLARCAFRGNTEHYVVSVEDAEFQCIQSVFMDNEGGAIAAKDRVTATLENCVFARNGGMDGGVYFGSRITGTVTHCSFAGGTANEVGLNSSNVVPTRVAFLNSIVWNTSHPPFEVSGGSVDLDVSYCLVSGGYAGDGNHDAEPRFRLGDPACRLSWDSPAIDAGAATAVTEDLAGEVRPQNDAPDMGAYEFGEDSDGGGLPDTYEADHGLNPGEPGDDALDSDGDGLDNREEFRRGTGPRDGDDPPSEFYVETSGSDETGDGSQTSPWRTITHALSAIPEPAATFPVTIHVGAGTFEEPVVFRPYVRVAGAGSGATTIQYYDAADNEHVVVRAAADTMLEGCTLTFPDPVTATAELVRIPDVKMQMTDVRLDGKDSPHAIGVFVTGASSSDSHISYCAFRRAEYGVYAVNSGVNITRNLFEDLIEGAIFIRPPDGKADAGHETPLVGDTRDAARTGFNRFRVSSGFLVKNMSPETTVAEYNDWGVYTDAEIEAGVAGSQGDVDYEPYIGKATVPSSIAVEVLDRESAVPIEAAQNPYVLLSSATTTRDEQSSLFIFHDVSPGTYTCEAGADQYAAESRSVLLETGQVAAVTFELQRSQEGEGEGEGEGETAPQKTGFFGCGLSVEDHSSRIGDVLLVLVTGLLMVFRVRRYSRGQN